MNDSPATVNIESKPLFNTATYGGLYSIEPQTFEFTTSVKITQIMLANTIPSLNVGYDTNFIQIFRPGDYEINFMICIFPNSNNYLISAGV